MKNITKQNIIKQNIFILINILIVILIVSFHTFCFKNFTVWNEEVAMGLYQENEGIFDCLFKNNEYGGGYIQLFLLRFFTLGLPFIFHIHPLDYASIPRGIILGIILAWLVFSSVNFIKPVTKSKLLYSCLLLISSAYLFFNYLCIYYLWVDINNYVFFRYFFGVLVYNIFWFFIYKNILRKNLKRNYFELIFVNICAFILAGGLEILILMSFINIFFLMVSCIKAKNFNKFVIIPVLIFILSVLIWIFTPAFQSGLHTKVPSAPNIDINYCIYYIKTFYRLYVPYIIPYFILFIICICILKKFPLKTYVKSVYLSLILEISAILGILSMFFCGDFYIRHTSIVLLFKILAIAPFCILIGVLVSQIRKYKTRKILTVLMSVSILIGSFFLIKQLLILTPKNGNIRQSKNSQMLNYINEKMIRFYYLRNETPIISTKGSRFSIFGAEYAEPSMIKKFVNYPEGECDFNLMTNMYLPRVYKSNISKELGYCASEKAIDKFYENGGFFTESELNNIKFSRLFDKSFIFEQDKHDIIPKEMMNLKMEDLDELTTYKPV